MADGGGKKEEEEEEEEEEKKKEEEEEEEGEEEEETLLFLPYSIPSCLPSIFPLSAISSLSHLPLSLSLSLSIYLSLSLPFPIPANIPPVFIPQVTLITLENCRLGDRIGERGGERCDGGVKEEWREVLMMMMMVEGIEEEWKGNRGGNRDRWIKKRKGRRKERLWVRIEGRRRKRQ